MPRILKDGRGNWAGVGSGYLTPSEERISSLLRVKRVLFKEYMLLLLQQVLISWKEIPPYLS